MKVMAKGDLKKLSPEEQKAYTLKLRNDIKKMRKEKKKLMDEIEVLKNRKTGDKKP